MNQVLRSSLALLEQELREGKIKLEYQFCPENPLIPLPSGVLKSVLINLIKNSEEALKNQNPLGGKRILIRSHCEQDLWRICVWFIIGNPMYC